MKKTNIKEIISRNSHFITQEKIEVLKSKNIDIKFLNSLLGFKIIESKHLIKRLNQLNLRYNKISSTSQKKINSTILKKIRSNNFSKTGKNRLEIWETGWGENLKDLNKKKKNSLLPKYYRKNNNLFRLNSQIIYSKNYKFDSDLQELVHICVLNKFSAGIQNIYEFGAGSGNVISKIISAYQNKFNYFASDWSVTALQILKKIRIKKNKINTFKFDFFNPNHSFKIKKNSLVITNGALEQTGSNYIKFIKYLTKNKPKLIINFEPISDFYDKNNLNDYVLKLYCKKRNYLKDYLKFLNKLKKMKKIEIIKKKRVGGGPFSESFSYVVWNFLS